MQPFFYHFHPLIAVLSILLFNYKFWRSYTNYDYTISRRSRILSRSLDALLLATGIILALYRGPHDLIFNVRWFDIKLVLVVLYIAMGIICLTAEKGSKKSLIFYILGMVCIVGIFYMVKVKPF